MKVYEHIKIIKEGKKEVGKGWRIVIILCLFLLFSAIFISKCFAKDIEIADINGRKFILDSNKIEYIEPKRDCSIFRDCPGQYIYVIYMNEYVISRQRMYMDPGNAGFAGLRPNGYVMHDVKTQIVYRTRDKIWDK